MSHYIDGFVFPVPRARLGEYQRVAEAVAEIWKEHGALDYLEYVGDDMSLEGTRSFIDAVDATEEEAVVFGWVAFESREARDRANEKVAADPRMAELLEPLVDSENPVFDAQRMAYGGFRASVPAIRRDRAVTAVSEAQRRAAEQGRDAMSLDEIEAEIDATRRDRA